MGAVASHVLPAIGSEERNELIERLVPLIPPPRSHQVLYHGILAPSASMRDRIVPSKPTRSQDDEQTEGVRSIGQNGDGRLAGESHPVFAEQRGNSAAWTFRRVPRSRRPRARGTDALGRPAPAESSRSTRFDAPAVTQRCRLIAAIEDPDVATRILRWLKLPARAPPLRAATASPEDLRRRQDDSFFDQSVGCDEP